MCPRITKKSSCWHHVNIMWNFLNWAIEMWLTWFRKLVLRSSIYWHNTSPIHNLEELESSSTSGQTQIKTLHWKSHNISADFAIGNLWLWWSIFDWIFKMSSSSNASNAPSSPLALPPWSQDNDRPARNPALDVLSGPRVAESRSRRMQFCSS